MPAKNKTSRPQHEIERFVKRFLAGEQAVTVAKEARISKAGFYLWVKKYKDAMLDRSKRVGMSSQSMDTANLRFENERLNKEVKRLKELLFNQMIKHGEL